MLAAHPGGGLRAYVVWLPMFRDTEADVPGAATRVPDRRALHYWDGHKALSKGLTAALSLPEPAWDIFLVYGPGARWDAALPPRPDFWMHQLGTKARPRVNGPYLDAEILESRVRGLMQ